MYFRPCALYLAAFHVLALSPVGLLAADAAIWLQKIGTPRGLCVVLGDSDGRLALDLAKSSELTIFAQSTSDDQVAAALTYIRREWGHTATPIPPSSVGEVRAATNGRTRPWTAEELLQIDGGRGASRH